MKKVAILQSNYIPWKGYFDLIAEVDEFILFDDVQYTRRDWRNRNLIKTPSGLKWITVPVKVKGRYDQKIKDTLIDSSAWKKEHLRVLYQNYKRAVYFDEIYNYIEWIYLRENYIHLSNLNRSLIEFVCNYLNIKTKISCSDNYNIVEGRSERLLEICKQSGASVYVSGPSARNYLQQMIFNEANITIDWFDYSGYPEYPQLWDGNFMHNVTVLDLLFNCGPNSINYMKACRKRLSL